MNARLWLLSLVAALWIGVACTDKSKDDDFAHSPGYETDDGDDTEPGPTCLNGFFEMTLAEHDGDRCWWTFEAEFGGFCELTGLAFHGQGGRLPGLSQAIVRRVGRVDAEESMIGPEPDPDSEEFTWTVRPSLTTFSRAAGRQLSGTYKIGVLQSDRDLCAEYGPVFIELASREMEAH
jgi:hypothetical protein